MKIKIKKMKMIKIIIIIIKFFLYLSIVNHFYLGYDLEYNALDGWGTAHYFKFGYRF